MGYYGLKEGEKVTLRTLLGKSSIEVISKARKAADDEIQTAIEALPGLDLKVLNLNKYGNLDTAIDFDGVLLERRGTPKRNADEFEEISAGSGCQINGVMRMSSMQNRENRRLVF